MFVKVCGITEIKQIDWAASLGYSAVGFVVYRKSKRFVIGDKLLNLINYAKGKIYSVAVSIDYDDVKPFANICDFIQFTNIDGKNEFEDKTILSGKKFPKNVSFKYFIYDESYGTGTYKTFPDELKKYRDKLILAGGLNAENVQDVIKKHKPFGVDVSSSVELQPGIKDYDLMKEFISKIKEVQND